MPILLNDLDEIEAGILLKLARYGVKKRPRQYVLICLCGNKSGDTRKNPKAWNGWQILPFAKCPKCLERKAEE